MRMSFSTMIFLLTVASSAQAAETALGPRAEVAHWFKAHEAHITAPSVAVGSDGRALIAWGMHQEGQPNRMFIARPGAPDAKPVRVNPDDLPIVSLHQSPGLAIGPGGEIYLSWSSPRPGDAVPFASDLRLSRSIDGGRTFDHHLRVNNDTPGGHSFDGLAVASDGTVIVSWIESADASEAGAGTYVARVGERGTHLEGVSKIGDSTCVCCRIDVGIGPKDAVALLWRKVFPESVRDMVVGVSRDGGRSFGDAALVHADRWHITACPHRGGTVAMDDRGRIYATWYTEGTEGRPDILFAVSPDGRRFTAPKRLHTSTASIPDHPRMAVDGSGRVVVVWEDSTAVRRRVLMRYTTDGGRTLSAAQVLSTAIKAYAPEIVSASDGTFAVVWHEERFPNMKTVVQTLRVDTR